MKKSDRIDSLRLASDHETLDVLSLTVIKRIGGDTHLLKAIGVSRRRAAVAFRATGRLSVRHTSLSIRE